MYKAIVFDLDGTLLNTILDIRDSMNRTLETLGLAVHDAQSYCYFVGNGITALARRAVGDLHPHLWERAEALYQADYEKNSAVSTKPYDGIPMMLQQINKLKIPVAVLSNKPHADTLSVIKHYFPEIDFAVVRGQVTGVPVKPDPTGALLIAKQLNVMPGECLYAGDTIIDMECANACGMDAVGVTWGFRKRDELERGKAKFIVNAPVEIIQLLS